MKRKILLVEDSPILIDGITNMLATTDNAVVDDFATTQKAAISLLDDTEYDIMIVDIELASGNGFEVVKHAQSEAYLHKPPVFVMLTNNATNDYRRYAKRIGVDYFYDKSMEFDLAIEKIEQLSKQ